MLYSIYIKIKSLYRKLSLRRLSAYYQVGKSSILGMADFRLIIIFPRKNHVYLSIGEDCIVGATFSFESEDGGHVKIGNHSYIGKSVFICRSSIEVGNNVTIAWGCTIYDHNSHSLDYMDRRQDISDQLRELRKGEIFIKNKNWDVVKSAPIKIEDDAWIGMNCIILKGVTIGRGAVVGAGSVVTKDVPPWCVVAGNPARVIKEISHKF